MTNGKWKMENAPRYLRSKDELLTFSKESTMQLNPHLSFNGQCQEAFKFYEQCLGGKIVAMVTHADMPAEAQIPAEWHDRSGWRRPDRANRRARYGRMANVSDDHDRRHSTRGRHAHHPRVLRHDDLARQRR